MIDKIGEVPARNYAVVIDEAHSSQTGEAAKDLRLALGAGEEQELTAAEAEDAGLLATAIDPVEEALAQIGRRAQRPPVEPLLLRLHRHAQGADAGDVRHASTRRRSVHEPFHLYSMRQAIEEGFIMDVLANYTTYQTFWKIEKATEEDPEYDAKKARRAIARFVSLHPHHLAQKAEIIVEHFRAAHRQGDGRTGQGDGRDLLPPARRPLQAEHRQVHPGQGLHGHQDPGRLLGQDRRRHRQAADRDQHERLSREPHGRGVRDPRVRRADRRREVPDRLRPAAAAHDVRRQAAGRPGGGPDPLAPQPHPPAEGEHLRPRLPQRHRGHRRGLRAVPRLHRRAADRSQHPLGHPASAR